MKQAGGFEIVPDHRSFLACPSQASWSIHSRLTSWGFCPVCRPITLGQELTFFSSLQSPTARVKGQVWFCHPLATMAQEKDKTHKPHGTLSSSPCSTLFNFLLALSIQVPCSLRPQNYFAALSTSLPPNRKLSPSSLPGDSFCCRLWYP